MNTLYNAGDTQNIINRIEKLTPESQRQWGKMNVGQMMAHCHIAMETVTGNHTMKPIFFIGRMIGKMMKPSVLSEKEWGKNSPTDKTYIFKGEHDLNEERLKTIASLRQFQEGGPSKCTTHPHPFFGHFTPEEWGVFQWKHMDHHLRQFGV